MNEHRPERDPDPPNPGTEPEASTEASGERVARPRTEPAAEEMGGESACQMHRFYDLDAEP